MKMNNFEKAIIIAAIAMIAISITFGRTPVARESSTRLLDVNDVPMLVTDINDINDVTIETTLTVTTVSRKNAGQLLKEAQRNYNNGLQEINYWTAETADRLQKLNDLKAELGIE